MAKLIRFLSRHCSFCSLLLAACLEDDRTALCCRVPLEAGQIKVVLADEMTGNTLATDVYGHRTNSHAELFHHRRHQLDESTTTTTKKKHLTRKVSMIWKNSDHTTCSLYLSQAKRFFSLRSFLFKVVDVERKDISPSTSSGFHWRWSREVGRFDGYKPLTVNCLLSTLLPLF